MAHDLSHHIKRNSLLNDDTRSVSTTRPITNLEVV